MFDLRCLNTRTSVKRGGSNAHLLKHRMLVIGFGIILVIGFLFGCSDDDNTSASTSTLPSTTSKGSYALIYNGQVAAEEGPEAVAAIAQQVGLSVIYVSNIAELPSLLNDAAVFIIGGTEDDLSPLKDGFTPDVMSAFQTYLRNGGRYWGICGGGYLASTGWDEEEGFVDMLGIVPAKSSEFDEDDAPQILPIQWLGETIPMYFQFGPAFDLTNSAEDVNVFAYYEDGSIAGLMSSYGNGKVAVCGPHPEATESWGEDIEDVDDWMPRTDLGVALLQDLLSDSPVNH